MKLFVLCALLFWLACGLGGAWMMEGTQDLHWKTIARGPLSLIEAFRDDPVTYQQ